jgi:hypothetical protein
MLCGAWLLATVPAAGSPTVTTTTLAVTSGGGTVSTVVTGTVVTLTATVKAGGTVVTAGQVNFCDATAAHCTDIHILGTAQLTKAGTATIKFRPGTGSHSYNAAFLGTTNFVFSTSANAALAVTGGSITSTVLTESETAGNYLLTATVSGVGVAAPTGEVYFLDTSNGNASLGAAALSAQTTRSNFFSTSLIQDIFGFSYQVVVGDFNGDGISVVGYFEIE